MKCDEAFTNLPMIEKIVAEIGKFLAVRDDGVEKVSQDERKERAR